MNTEIIKRSQMKIIDAENIARVYIYIYQTICKSIGTNGNTIIEDSIDFEIQKIFKSQYYEIIIDTALF